MAPRRFFGKVDVSEFDQMYSLLTAADLQQFAGADAWTYRPPAAAGGADVASVAIIGDERTEEREGKGGRRSVVLRDLTVVTEPANDYFGNLATGAIQKNGRAVIAGVEYAIENVTYGSGVASVSLIRTGAMSRTREPYDKRERS